MVKIRVGNINVGLIYKYDNYFKNNIESYINNNIEVNHIIEVIYKDNLIALENDKVLSETKDEIKAMFRYDKNYNKIQIFINDKLFSKDTIPHAEYIYMGVAFLELSYLYDFLPLHGSALKVNNEALIFSAPSGTGKSTHAKLWIKHLSAEYINEDKPLLRIEDNTIYVYGSPFSGENKLNNNYKVELKSIIFLKQSPTNKIKLMDKTLILEHLIKNILRPDNELFWDKALNTLAFIVENIDIYKLSANMNVEAAEIVHNKIFEKE